MPRVVITGLGIISALGHNLAENWQSLSAGRPAIGPIAAVDTSAFKFKNGAEARGFNPEEYGLKPEFLDRFAQFAAAAAKEAMRSSGLKVTPELGPRMAIITGSCVGGQDTQDAGFTEVYKKGGTRVHPLTIPRTMANAGASAISTEFGVRGPVYTVSTACSSSNHAMGQAFWMVRSGMADAAITGGSEAPFSFGLLKAWEAMRVVSPDTCRPFSKDRKGLILGEGAAMLVIESLEHAQARGATIFGEIAGFGMSSDAGHITAPSAEGAAMAMTSAMRDAQISPSQVGYINAHGTGTLLNDSTETKAIKLALGPHAGNAAVSSTKSMHGHALGAAGALEAVASVMALKEGLLPPTANFNVADPECDLDVIANQPRQKQVEYAMSNSFAFGGLNAVLVFRRWNG
jgi:nodulation protein E